MTIVIFALGLLLIGAGAGSLAASLNLLPTELGMLYAVIGVILIAAGVVTLAIGLVVRRLDALTRLVHVEQLGEHASELVSALTDDSHEADLPPHESDPPPPESAMEAGEPEAMHEGNATLAVAATDQAAREPVEAPSEESHFDHAPTIAEIEQAMAEPDGPPTLVGHYSAGGANYKIFSDGSIEAETETGAFRFASMDDFKAYLAGERA